MDRIKFPASLMNSPSLGEEIMATKDARQLMLDYNGQIMLSGVLYRIVVKSSGAGTQRVSLEPFRRKVIPDES